MQKLLKMETHLYLHKPEVMIQKIIIIKHHDCNLGGLFLAGESGQRDMARHAMSSLTAAKRLGRLRKAETQMLQNRGRRLKQ